MPSTDETPVVDSPVETGAFGIDAFTLDDRMRLFHFAAAEKRNEYLWLLRAFDRGRANYQVLLHAASARDLLDQLRAEHPGCPEIGEVQPLLDSLNEWRLLDRSYDGTRAATWPNTVTGTTSTSSPRPVTGRTGRSRTCSARPWRTLSSQG
jgi:hypothetical protein